VPLRGKTARKPSLLKLTPAPAAALATQAGLALGLFSCTASRQDRQRTIFFFLGILLLSYAARRVGDFAAMRRFLNAAARQNHHSL
jgi:hypothetical protein